MLSKWASKEKESIYLSLAPHVTMADDDAKQGHGKRQRRGAKHDINLAASSKKRLYTSSNCHAERDAILTFQAHEKNYSQLPDKGESRLVILANGQQWKKISGFFGANLQFCIDFLSP